MSDREQVITSWLREQFNGAGNFMHGPDDAPLLARDLAARLAVPGPKDWVIAVDPGPKMPPGGWVLRPPRA